MSLPTRQVMCPMYIRHVSSQKNHDRLHLEMTCNCYCSVAQHANWRSNFDVIDTFASKVLCLKSMLNDLLLAESNMDSWWVLQATVSSRSLNGNTVSCDHPGRNVSSASLHDRRIKRPVRIFCRVKIGLSFVSEYLLGTGSGAKNNLFWSCEEGFITDPNRLLIRWADRMSLLCNWSGHNTNNSYISTRWRPLSRLYHFSRNSEWGDAVDTPLSVLR